MAIPSSIEARLYYRCAFQRYEDAQVLRKAEHTTGAVYLAGYGVECILKALILVAVAPGGRKSVLESFRGGWAHDYEWLRTQYLTNGGARFPREVNQRFTLVNDWSTELRYVPRTVKDDDADSFMVAAAAILRWADGRLLNMPIAVARGNTDEVINRIMEALRSYEADHPHAQIDLYRQNPVSVRVRIVDPDLAGANKSQRNQLAWNYLGQLPDEVQSDISTLLLLTPDETKMSFANFEFNDPVPSAL